MGKGEPITRAQLSAFCRQISPSRTCFLSSASRLSPPPPFLWSFPHCLLLCLIKVQRLHLPLLSESRNQTAQQPPAERSQHKHRPSRLGLPWPASLHRRRSPRPRSLGHPPSRRSAAAGLEDLNAGAGTGGSSYPRPSCCTRKLRGWVGTPRLRHPAPPDPSLTNLI